MIFLASRGALLTWIFRISVKIFGAAVTIFGLTVKIFGFAAHFFALPRQQLGPGQAEDGPDVVEALDRKNALTAFDLGVGGRRHAQPFRHIIALQLARLPGIPQPVADQGPDGRPPTAPYSAHLRRGSSSTGNTDSTRTARAGRYRFSMPGYEACDSRSRPAPGRSGQHRQG